MFPPGPGVKAARDAGRTRPVESALTGVLNVTETAPPDPPAAPIHSPQIAQEPAPDSRSLVESGRNLLRLLIDRYRQHRARKEQHRARKKEQRRFDADAQSERVDRAPTAHEPTASDRITYRRSQHMDPPRRKACHRSAIWHRRGTQPHMNRRRAIEITYRRSQHMDPPRRKACHRSAIWHRATRPRRPRGSRRRRRESRCSAAATRPWAGLRSARTGKRRADSRGASSNQQARGTANRVRAHPYDRMRTGDSAGGPPRPASRQQAQSISSATRTTSTTRSSLRASTRCS